MSTTVQWHEKDRVNELFLGKSILSVDKGASTVLLSDGTVLEIVPNEGGCCGGWFELQGLATCESIITRAQVKVEEFGKPQKQYKGKRGKKGSSSAYEDGKIYSLFVFADAVKINAVTVEGDDGSGRYGSGFTIEVKEKI